MPDIQVNRSKNGHRQLTPITDNQQPTTSNYYDMHVRKLLCLVALTFISLRTLSAQDIHFTQFDMAPLSMLNPGYIGKFQGTVRLGGIYRGQWASVLGGVGNQYSTPSLYVDAPIFRGFRKRDWIGLGIAFTNDKAGTGNLRRTTSLIGGAYHFALDKKGITTISASVQWGGTNSRADWDNFQFEDGLLKNPSQPYKPGNSADYSANQTNQKVQNKDLNAGLVLSTKLNKMMGMTLGFAMYHISKPDASLLGKGTPDPNNPNPPSGGGGNYEIARRSIAHGQFPIQINDRTTITPQFMYQTMSGHDEIQVQGMAGYLFNPEKDITLNFGIGYRLRDAVSPIVGAKVKNLRVGVAYDFRIAPELNTYSNYRGGFELAAYYIVKIYKPAVVKPKVLCPRY